MNAGKIKKLSDRIEFNDDFSDKQVRNIKRIIDKIGGLLTGEWLVFDSGGNHGHLFLERRDKRWIAFHSGTGDITLSSNQLDKDVIYEEFWEDSEPLFTYNLGKKEDDVEFEFNNINQIILLIRNEDFYNIFTGKKITEDIKMETGGVVSLLSKELTLKQIFE